MDGTCIAVTASPPDVRRGGALERRFVTALPPDVRRGSAPSERLHLPSGLRPWFGLCPPSEFVTWIFTHPLKSKYGPGEGGGNLDKWGKARTKGAAQVVSAANRRGKATASHQLSGSPKVDERIRV